MINKDLRKIGFTWEEAEVSAVELTDKTDIRMWSACMHA